MKVFVRLMFGVFLFFVLLMIASFFVPSEFNIERKIMINANYKKIAPLLSDLHNWNEWSVWSSNSDSTMILNYDGSEIGEGSRVSWQGRLFGAGRIEILSNDAPDSITYIMNIGNAELNYYGIFYFDDFEDKTLLTWQKKGKVGWNPADKLIVLVSDNMLGKDIEKGLKQIKNAAESE